MRALLLIIGLLLAVPAFAQSTQSKYDKDECIALAHHLDTPAPATQAEKNHYYQCNKFFECDKITEGDWMRIKTHEALLRYILKTCQNYDPPRKLRLKE